MRRRRGNALLVAVASLAMVGFAALVIDLGFERRACAELQSAADFAALSAVQALDGTSAGLTRAAAVGLSVGNAHLAGGRNPAFTNADFVWGEYKPATGTFVAVVSATRTNSVRVTRRITGYPTWFGRVLGVQTMAARASSFSYRPLAGSVGRVSCTLPLAVPKCAIEADMRAKRDVTLQFSSARRDNVAWASTGGFNGANYFRDQLDPPSNGTCRLANAGDPVKLQNGQVTTALTVLRQVINAQNSGTGRAVAWDAARWGAAPTWANRILPSDDNGDGRIRSSDGETHSSTVLQARYGYSIQGAMMVFETPDANGNGVGDFCEPGGASYTGDRTLAGFVMAAIYDVDDTGSDTAFRLKVSANIEQSTLATGGGGTLDFGLKIDQAPRLGL